MMLEDISEDVGFYNAYTSNIDKPYLAIYCDITNLFRPPAGSRNNIDTTYFLLLKDCICLKFPY